MSAVGLDLNSCFEETELVDEVVLPAAMESHTHRIIHDVVI